MTSKTTVLAGGTVSIPREALASIGIDGQAFIRMAVVGSQVVITRVPLMVVTPKRR